MYVVLQRADFLGFFDPDKQYPNIDQQAEKQAYDGNENYCSYILLHDVSRYLDEGFFTISESCHEYDLLSLTVHRLSFSRKNLTENPELWETGLIQDDLLNIRKQKL